MVEVIGTSGATGAAQYGFSENGRLVYVSWTANVAFQLAWVSRDRGLELLPFAPRESSGLDLSPNGLRIALEIEGTDEDGDGDHIWIYDVERGGSQVVLTTEGDNENPVWSPDGEWVFFASPRGGVGAWLGGEDRSPRPAERGSRHSMTVRHPKQGHCVEDAARELHLDTLAFHRARSHASTDDCFVPVDGVFHHAALAVA